MRPALVREGDELRAAHYSVMSQVVGDVHSAQISDGGVKVVLPRKSVVVVHTARRSGRESPGESGPRHRCRPSGPSSTVPGRRELWRSAANICGALATSRSKRDGGFALDGPQSPSSPQATTMAPSTMTTVMARSII
jgi:hypothetical protein